MQINVNKYLHVGWFEVIWQTAFWTSYGVFTLNADIPDWLHGLAAASMLWMYAMVGIWLVRRWRVRNVKTVEQLIADAMRSGQGLDVHFASQAVKRDTLMISSDPKDGTPV